jgi:hypothetical protein
MYAAVTMPEKWSNQMELFSMEGKTCGAFFKFVTILSFFLPLGRVLVWTNLVAQLQTTELSGRWSRRGCFHYGLL